MQERGMSMYELHQAQGDIVCSLQLCPWPERRISTDVGRLKYRGAVESLQVEQVQEVPLHCFALTFDVQSF